MTEKLIIKNFGPIKNAEIDLKKILVLIGPQSTGKSTVAKLVTILRSVELVIEEKTFLSLLESYNIKSYVQKNTLIEYISEPYSFVYQNKKSSLSSNKNHEFNNLKKEFNKNNLDASYNNIRSNLYNQYNKLKESFEEEETKLEKGRKAKEGRRLVEKELALLRKEIDALSEKLFLSLKLIFRTCFE